MSVEQYLLSNKHAKPLGWVLVGLALFVFEARQTAEGGVTAGTWLFFGLGIVSVVAGLLLWRTREQIEDADAVSVTNHLVIGSVVVTLIVLAVV